MKMFTAVAVVRDSKCLGIATALRGVLEPFALHVELLHLLQARQVREFFDHPRPAYAHTVLVCHGDGEDDAPYLVFDVVDQVNGQHDRPEGWRSTPVHCTPSWVAAHVRHGQGTLVSLACGSGREPLARAFLEAGYTAYVGPTEPYIDYDSSLVFAINWFHLLLSEDWDYGPGAHTEREALTAASAVDGDWPYGTRAFALYGSEVQRFRRVARPTRRLEGSAERGGTAAGGLW